MLKRAAYLDRIKNTKNDSCIKLIAGIRYSGKTFLLCQVISELKLSGIDDEHIIYLNCESDIFEIPRTTREIEDFITQKTSKTGKYYLFLDEIQTISGWEKFLAALLQQKKLDIYISVSDASPLLKDTSRREKKYVLINFKPFSFSEYMRFFVPEAKPGCGLLGRAMALKNSECDHFGNYMRYGGFPAAYIGLFDSLAGLSGIRDEDIETILSRLNGIYSSILLHDVIRRAKIRNVDLLERIINIIFLNIGKQNSAQNITQSLRKDRYTKNLSLVPSYLKALENAFVIKKIYRCNLSTGKILRISAKYFIGDHALLNAVKGIKENTSEGILENVLVHDLERREYVVYTGKFDGRYVDFVAKRGNIFILLQTISKKTGNEALLEQKTETLVLLNDNEKFSLQRKYVIFLDVDSSFGHETGAGTGIHYISLQDFLLLEDISQQSV
jgi:predicted AAA+ superfamily ATPase